MGNNAGLTVRINAIVETFIQKKRYGPAVEDLEKLQHEFGNDDRMVYYLGVCYANLHNHDKALECLDFVAYSDELSMIQRIQSHMLLGMIYTDLEDFANAEKSLKAALEVNPQSSMSCSALGFVYYLTKRYDLAIFNFKRAIQIDPNNASAHNNLGYTYTEIGINLNEAVKECRKAVALSPRSPAYRDSLGWTYFTLENYTDSAKELENALHILTEIKKTLSEKQFNATFKVINGHLTDAVRRRDRKR